MKNIAKKTAAIAFFSIFSLNLALASDADPQKFVVSPAHPNAVNPNTLMYELKPGDQTTDEITIENLSSDTKKLTLYLTDEFLDKKTGEEAFKNPGEDITMEKLAKLDARNVTLGPRETKTVTLTVNIPKNQTLGDYIGGVAAVNTFPSKNMPNIKIAVRYIQNLDIKVTDSPKHIPLIGEANIFATQVYLPISLAVFVACMGYFLWENTKEKKRRELAMQKPKNDSDGDSDVSGQKS